MDSNNSNASEHNLDDANLATVAERADEMSASIVVSVLKDAGIRAMSTGEFTSGFRAEAPGMVQIKVFEKDVEQARKVISEIKQAP